jgi:hypothetical protein
MPFDVYKNNLPRIHADIHGYGQLVVIHELRVFRADSVSKKTCHGFTQTCTDTAILSLSASFRGIPWLIFYLQPVTTGPR